MKKVRYLSPLFLFAFLLLASLTECSKKKSDPLTFTVSFESNGGSAISPLTTESGLSIAKPTDPIRTNYIFDGWYSDANLATSFDFNTAITSSITLYAKWTLTHTLTFNSNGGSAVGALNVKTGAKASKPTDPTRADYFFVGWYKEEALTNVFDFSTETITQNLTLYAKWTTETYTLTFNSNNGSTVGTLTVGSGAKASKPTDPTRANYTFGGWYKEEALTNAFDFNTETITQNLTLYAKWVVITYTISFHSNSGSAVETLTVESGAKANKPTNPTRANDIFGGWYKEEALTNAFDFSTETITQNLNLYAKWIGAYAITFNSNGGSAVEPLIVESGAKASKPNPSKGSDGFMGWYSDEGLTTAFDFNTAITSNITLYARWKTGSYSIDADGGLTRVPNESIVEIPYSVGGTKVSILHGINETTNIFGNADNGENTTVTKVIIPEGITAIDNAAFNNCKNLTNVTLPNSLNSVGLYAFQGCSALTSITLPANISSIGSLAFSESGLTSITLPANISYIAMYAFAGCSHLTSVRVEASNPPDLRTNVFFGTPSSLSITVPTASLDAYKGATNWSSYANKITGY